MKKVVFVIGIFINSLTILSQADSSSNSKLNYGFNLGVNHSNLIESKVLPNNASLSNGLGFRLGVLMDYRITDFMFISPKAEMSFNNSKVYLTNTDGSSSEHNVMPISIEFMTHFIFKKKNEKLSPYLYFGPNVKIPVSKKSSNSTAFSTNTDFAIDFGIGIEKPFTYFNFSPELRYSFGLLDVNQHPSIQSLYFHNISIVLNFVG